MSPTPETMEERYKKASIVHLSNGECTQNGEPVIWVSRDEMLTFTRSEIKLARLSLLNEIEKELGEEKPEMVFEKCVNCGTDGYGKAWFGKGKPNDPHGYGDAYFPTGSAVFCKECSPDFSIGKEYEGEEIWKRTSERLEHENLRLGHIQKKDENAKSHNTFRSHMKEVISKLRGK